MSYRRMYNCFDGPDYWRWFDLMPKSIRDQLNNAESVQEVLTIWRDAVTKYGDEIERKLAK